MIRTLGALVGAAGKADALARVACGACRARACEAAGLRAPPARLFRGMGRADDLRHRLGVGADRRSRAVIDVFAHLAREKNAKDRIVAAAAGDRGQRRTSSSARGAARNSCPRKVAARPRLRRQIPAVAHGLAARDQIAADPPARPGRADRRARCAGPDRRRMGRKPTGTAVLELSLRLQIQGNRT